MSQNPAAAPRYGTLFLLSVIGLFVEMMLIRWVSTELRVFAYLQNTVLVVCFLGLGMGCWSCRQPIAAWHVLVPLLAIVAILALPERRAWMQDVTQGFTLLKDFHVWDPSQEVDRQLRLNKIGKAIGATLALMILLWHIFVPQGRLLGRLFEDAPNIVRAYSINVAGSLVGIGLFVLLSALYQPPWVWCAAAALLALPFLRWRWRWGIEPVLLAGVVALATVPQLMPEAAETVWSPYQKLSTHLDTPEPTVRVNNSNYFYMMDLRPEAVRGNPKLFGDPDRLTHYYDIPSRLKPHAERVLIVGAGSGNDIAGVLRGGAKHVVAVEIDPAIIAIGRKRHAEKPYDDPRVEVVNDDARAYFARNTEPFDLIVFGLLDSHTTTAMMNARLDHFVYTRESFQQVRRLLKDDGLVVLCFAAVDFQVLRFDRLLRQTFGDVSRPFMVPPTAYGTGGVVFVAAKHPDAGIDRRLRDDPKLRAATEEVPLKIAAVEAGTLPTDDWPYLYLEKPYIPEVFGLMAAMLVVLYLYGVLWIGLPVLPRHPDSRPWHFFFMGAAFLLLETANISRSAVVLGNTWDVNAVIVGAIMIFILLANAVASAWPRLPLGVAYGGLLGSCLALYFVELAWFNEFAYFARALLVGGLACLPVFFSGIIFVRSFAAVKGKDAALGANLLGALAGGLLQALTFLVGIKALLLIVAGLYLLALLTRPRTT